MSKSHPHGMSLPLGHESLETEPTKFTISFEGKDIQIERSGGEPQAWRPIYRGAKGKWCYTESDMEAEAERVTSIEQMELFPAEETQTGYDSTQ